MNSERDMLHAAASKESNCLPVAALERMAGGTGSDAERAHVASCPYCSGEIAMLQSFQAAEPTAAEAAVVRQIEKQLQQAPAWRPTEVASKQAWWFARPVWGLGLVAALALIFFVNSPSSSPVAPIDDTVRVGQIESISPTGDLASIPSQLQWRAVPGAVSYEIRLMDVAEEVLWQTSATAPLVHLPAEAQVLMTERKTLTWRIRAMDAKGATVAASAAETFRVIAK
jgi:hypothetical protein